MDGFSEIGLIIVVAILIIALMRILRQPLIIGYILTGVVVGPAFLNIIASTEVVKLFSEIGVVLLLFIVGLGLSPNVIKEVGKVSLMGGMGQVIFTFIPGYLIAKYLFHFNTTTSLYIAIAFTLSSTIIVMKLLSDKGDMETLYGKISIGFLIIQDLVAILVLMLISSLSSSLELKDLIISTTLKGIGLVLLLFLIGYYVMPKLTRIIAKSQEFLLLFSIGWSLALAALFDYLNYTLEIGALLAGVTLSMSPYRYEITSRMKPLRDFFIVLFFILVGTQIAFKDITPYIVPIILFSLFILIGSPVIVMIIMGLMGYTKRNSFLVGIAIAQISEFSLILVALGVQLGHLSTEILSLITTIGFITIAGSSYMMLYSDKLFLFLAPYLSVFEFRKNKVEHADKKTGKYDIILFGCNRIGYDLLESIKRTKNNFLVVDYNPDIVQKLTKEGINCMYGDVGDSELLSLLKLKEVKMIISTIPKLEDNLILLDKVKTKNNKAIFIAVSYSIEEAIRLYDSGATYIIMPHFLGAHHASTIIEEQGFDFNKFIKQQKLHLEYLKQRKSMGHEHPKDEKKI